LLICDLHYIFAPMKQAINKFWWWHTNSSGVL